MISSPSYLFWAAYLYGSAFLLPLHIACCIGFPGSLSLHLRHQLYKVSLVTILLIPILFTSLSIVTGPGTPGNENFSAASPGTGGLLPAHPSKASGYQPPASTLSNGLVTPREYRQTALSLLYCLSDLATVISLAGLAVLLVRISGQRRYVRSVRRRALMHRTYKGCEIVTSNRIRHPFSLGIASRSIYLPARLSRADRNVIIAHEINHFRGRHHYWALIESLVRHLFWFNPVSHAMPGTGTLLREMECDQATLRSVDRCAYSRLLLKTAGNGQPQLAAQQWSPKRILRQRITQILSDHTPKKPRLVSVLLISGLILGTGLAACITLMNDGAIEKEIWAKTASVYSRILEKPDSITIDQVPGHLIDILVFNEDASFFSHRGISAKSALRALANNLSGGPLQGGSTISQQLAKVLFLKSEGRTLARKFRQVRAARIMEDRFSKAQILEMYLNTVYFGQGAFGVSAAARTFFKHPASDLDIAESAMLVQSLASPRDHNRAAVPDLAAQRTERLLNRMIEHGRLKRQAAEQSMNALKQKLAMAS